MDKFNPYTKDLCQITKDLKIIYQVKKAGTWMTVIDSNGKEYGSLLVDEECPDFISFVRLLDIYKREIVSANENYPGLYKDIFLKLLELSTISNDYEKVK